MRRGLFACLFLVGCNNVATGVATIESDLPQLPAKFKGSAALLSLPTGELRLVVTNVSAPTANVCDVTTRANADAFESTFVATVTLPAGARSGGTFYGLPCTLELTDSSCAAVMSDTSPACAASVDDSMRGFVKLSFPGATLVATVDAPICDAVEGGTPPSCAALPPCTDGGVETCSSNGIP